MNPFWIVLLLSTVDRMGYSNAGRLHPSHSVGIIQPILWLLNLVPSFRT